MWFHIQFIINIEDIKVSRTPNWQITNWLNDLYRRKSKRRTNWTDNKIPIHQKRIITTYISGWLDDKENQNTASISMSIDKGVSESRSRIENNINIISFRGMKIYIDSDAIDRRYILTLYLGWCLFVMNRNYFQFGFWQPILSAYWYRWHPCLMAELSILMIIELD